MLGTAEVEIICARENYPATPSYDHILIAPGLPKTDSVRRILRKICFKEFDQLG